MMCKYLALVLVVVFGPRNSEHLRFAPSPPKITLDSYLNDFSYGQNPWSKFSDLPDEERDAIYKTVEGGYVFFSAYEVQLNCEAPYPIEWRVSNLSDAVSLEFVESDIQTYTVRNGSLEQSPSSWSYNAVLKLYLLEPFISNNYTCSGLEANHNSHRQSSVFIYLAVQGISVIAETGSTFDINVNGKSVVVLPCRLTYSEDDTLKVELQKQIEKDDLSITWDPVPLNDSVAYDFRLGFLLTVKDLPGIVGYFKCIINATDNETRVDDDAVYYRISNAPYRKDEVIDLSFRIKERGSAAMSLETESNAHSNTLRFVCCSDSKDPPKLLMNRCHNPADCDYSKTFAFGSKTRQKAYEKYHPSETGYPTSNCSFSYIFDPIFNVKCKGEGIDILQTYHYKFKPSNASLGLRSSHLGIGMGATFYDHHDMELISASYPPDVLLENMIKLDYFPSAKDNFGLPQPIPGSGLGGNANDKSLYTGTTMTFWCAYSTYVFSNGGYWVVKWKTGDSKMFYDDVGEKSRYIYWDSYPGYLSLTMKLERELESVKCACSVMNTSEWKFKDIKVSVIDPVAPSFLIPEEEVVWKLHSKNASLSCDKSGTPLSNKVTWKKDGKKIRIVDAKLLRIQTYVKEQRSVLIVPEVSHEMHGEYSCSIQNIAGTATKVFNVYVEETDSSATIVWTILVSIFVIIVGGMTVVVWKYGFHNLKRMVTKLLCA